MSSESAGPVLPTFSSESAARTKLLAASQPAKAAVALSADARESAIRKALQEFVPGDLPVEQPVVVPPEIIASFNVPSRFATVVQKVRAGRPASVASPSGASAASSGVLTASETAAASEPTSRSPHGEVDAITLHFPGNGDPRNGADIFDDMGQNIPRDSSNHVLGPREIVKRFNEYDYEGSVFGRCSGTLLTCATAGLYLLTRRKVVQPNTFGVYVSSGRYMLTMPGIRFLRSTTDRWMESIPIDDERNLVRTYGSKTILYVPENHIGGAYRLVDGADGEITAGEYVIFGQGFHVIGQDRYQKVQITKLTGDMITLGPLTVLFIREGFLGGAFSRASGKFQVLYPGRPRLLHEKNFVDVSLAKVSKDSFKLGPIEFVTVPEGPFIGGAFTKEGGIFQLLPPGHTYRLHSKDYEEATLVERSDFFELGPYYVVTSRKGSLVGTFKRKTGEYVILPEDHTYWLKMNDYHKPDVVQIGSHVTVCGPLTILCCQDGMIAGAYRVADGSFEEFTDASRIYVLHAKDYHNLVRIPSNAATAQSFGPFKTVTVREGFCGVFENAGRIEIKDPGFYKVNPNYQIRDPVSLQIFNQDLASSFKSKDGIEMRVRAALTWAVNDPHRVARHPTPFGELQKEIAARGLAILLKLCRQYTRGDLLPTQEDILSKMENAAKQRLAMQSQSATQASPSTAAATGVLVDWDEHHVSEEAQKEAQKMYESLRDTSLSLLQESVNSAGFGVEIRALQITGFELLDESIMDDLSKITRSRIATKTARVRGEQQIAEAEALKRSETKKAEADANVQMVRARAAADVKTTQIESEARAKVEQAKAEAEARVLVETSKARAESESRAMILQIEARTLRERAAAEGEAIKSLASANYEKSLKEFEASSRMPEKQFELLMAREAVTAMTGFGNAAWRHPYQMSEIMEKFLPLLRIGPTSLAEVVADMQKPSTVAQGPVNAKAQF